MSSDLWGPIDPTTWSNVPSMCDACATEIDVKAGRAVFYLKGGGTPYSIPLPHCALWSNPDEQNPVPGIIIQAEHGDGQVIIGFRPLAGGNVLGLLSEFHLVTNPAEFGQ